jgi:hypothetical protein
MKRTRGCRGEPRLGVPTHPAYAAQRADPHEEPSRGACVLLMAWLQPGVHGGVWGSDRARAPLDPRATHRRWNGDRLVLRTSRGPRGGYAVARAALDVRFPDAQEAERRLPSRQAHGLGAEVFVEGGMGRGWGSGFDYTEQLLVRVTNEEAFRPTSLMLRSRRIGVLGPPGVTLVAMLHFLTRWQARCGSRSRPQHSRS